MAGSKFEQIKWSMARAAYEWGCDRDTLKAMITRGGIEPSFSGERFSTKQIDSAINGDYDAQRTRKVTVEANLLEMEEKQSRGELVVKAEVVSLVTGGLQAMVATVLAMTEITIEQREKIIEQLRECGERVARGDKDSDSTAALHGSDVG